MWFSTWLAALTKTLEGIGKVERLFNIWHAAQMFYVLSTWGLALVGWALIYYVLLSYVSNLTYNNASVPNKLGSAIWISLTIVLHFNSYIFLIVHVLENFVFGLEHCWRAQNKFQLKYVNVICEMSWAF